MYRFTMRNNRRYSDRPEVKQWQDEAIWKASKVGYTTTLMGRRRNLPDLLKDSGASWGARGHAKRAAINTPIQGGAADVVNAAMIDLFRDRRLREMGWRILLQVHDEVLLEGPKESVDEALARVKIIMSRPNLVPSPPYCSAVYPQRIHLRAV
jgi:DNA polymerase-1